MPNYQYTKSGNLDMRYSSSKDYVASGGSRSGPSGGGYSSYGGGNSSSSYYSGASSRSTSHSSDLHYTKSGNLDMRYSSSKAFAANSGSRSFVSSFSANTEPLHYTKSGALDMRYNSSKAAAGAGVTPRRSPGASYSSSSAASRDQELHYTKSGTLDMRYTTSKALMNSMMEKLKINEEPACPSTARGRVPQHVPLTKQGLPDMRFRVAKDWVATQSLNFTDIGTLPTWLPKLKDGRVDMHKNVVKAFFDPKAKGPLANAQFPPYNPEARRNYYRRRCEEDRGYQRCIQQSRREPVYDNTIFIPDFNEVRSIQETMNSILGAPLKSSGNGDGKAAKISSAIKTIEYDAIKEYCTDDRKLGTGGFGTVYRGTWNGKPVAIKKLLMDSLGKTGKAQFVKEVTIMSIFRDHTNLVEMFGYSLEPACAIVMEYVKLGSLSWLIHRCEDAAVEAKIRDGRIKKKLTCGIVSGMIQLHTAQIIHRDLKPQNVLVTEDYTAKIADFGFSSLRGRTASLVGTSAFAADDDILAGTAAYMAPELIDGDAKVTQAADVYAFGIVMNEIIHEEEPYSESFADLAARGPFGAALLAKSGKRPMLNKERVPGNVKNIIEACWNIESAQRPSFVDVARLLNRLEIKFPDYTF